MGLKEDAQTVLYRAYRTALENPDFKCSRQRLIDTVLDSGQLTYKYILFTALLAKATDESLNPLCLQKHADLPGAYDARSLCHKVIVPFEMEVLRKALGGSNEPFLNKPARTPKLDKSNPVRNGEGRKILYALYDGLPTLKSSREAFDALTALLCRLIRVRDEETERFPKIRAGTSGNPRLKLLAYIDKALEKSAEGEILTLMTAGIYHLYYLKQEEIRVEVHPVNQSGASGREISDLDIYRKNALLFANELKDKAYSETDVRHAADKVLLAGGAQMLFIEGPRGKATGQFQEKLEREYRSRDFLLSIVPYDVFFPTVISLTDNADCEEFIRFILQIARNTKFKRKTIQYLSALAEEMFGFRAT